ncbi:MAG TPA: response regulator [Roseiarcus sp.]|nr:response regulator [Roseiarcus sp.]
MACSPPRRATVIGGLARPSLVSRSLIAIIDDDEELCFSLVDLMHSVGHRAEPFASAENFLSSSNLPVFDCIVADVHMPGMSGFDLVRRLREEDRATPVILITALPYAHLDAEALSTGALSLIRKPFEAAALLEFVDRSLSK